MHSTNTMLALGYTRVIRESYVRNSYRLCFMVLFLLIWKPSLLPQAAEQDGYSVKQLFGNHLPSVNTLFCLSLLLQGVRGGRFMSEEFIRAFLIVAGAASGRWHLLKKSQTRNIIVKMSKASCCLCMSIEADMYEGRRGDGAQVLAVIGLFIPKCLGLRPP